MADVVRNLTVGAALALGANPRDPHLSHIHEFTVDDRGQLMQYQLTPKGDIKPIPIKMAVPPTLLTPSRTERDSRVMNERSIWR
jgi:hypothetical protein